MTVYFSCIACLYFPADNGMDPISIMREGSPGSDDSGFSSICSSSGGNFVQKQIERLHGGTERIFPARLNHQTSSTGSLTTTSTPPYSDDRIKSFKRQHSQDNSTPQGKK